MVWQVRSAGETDTTKLHGIKEEIKEKYAAYLLPPKNAFGAKNFNNMKGDRDAKIAGQIVEMNQQLDKEKKAYTKNLQNKYAQVLVDSWTKEGLPEWAEADIKKLKSKSEYKNMEEKQLLQAYALKLVESNWVDEDDRNNYKNKNKQATLTGANIVAALIRTWVIAVLLADDVKDLPKNLNQETFKDFFAENGDNFRNLRGGGTSANTPFQNIKKMFNTVTIQANNANSISTTEYVKIRNWLQQGINSFTDINTKDNPIVSITNKIQKIAINKKLVDDQESNDIFSTKDIAPYFDGDDFNEIMGNFFTKIQKTQNPPHQT